MALQPGTTLGPYQIDAPLGAGGMGEVYQATDAKLDRARPVSQSQATGSGQASSTVRLALSIREPRLS